MSDQEDRVAALSDDDRPDAAANEAASDAEDADVNNDELQAEMDDLFGDDAGEEAEESKQRTLDDSELDSGDDVDRTDRVGIVEDEDEVEAEQQLQSILDLDWQRNGAPMPSDGELYLMKVPHFLEFDPKGFKIDSFAPPVANHHSKTAGEANFSAFKTAMTTVRWRRAPSKPSELQSNARVLRWSDGSLTMQFASDPLTQYEIQPKALAPPQQNPVKSTPLSKTDPSGRTHLSKPGNLKQETYTYLGQPSQTVGMIPLVQKFTTALQVIPAGNTTDDAMEKLRRSMAAAQSNDLMQKGNFVATQITEDPELQKKRAEQAEKEKVRMQRRIENQQQKENLKQNRARDRMGMGRSAGLTIGDLEDDGMGFVAPSRKGNKGARAPKKRRSTQYEEWSEDEEGGQDYEEDDFVAADEEEEEDAEGEDEEEDFDALIERRMREEKVAGKGPAAAAAASKPIREGTPKRSRSTGDEDAGHDSPVSRVKRRRVVDEEDEDD